MVYGSAVSTTRAFWFSSDVDGGARGIVFVASKASRNPDRRSTIGGLGSPYGTYAEPLRSIVTFQNTGGGGAATEVCPDVRLPFRLTPDRGTAESRSLHGACKISRPNWRVC